MKNYFRSLSIAVVLLTYQNCSMKSFKAIEGDESENSSVALYNVSRLTKSLFSAAHVLINRKPSNSELVASANAGGYEKTLRSFLESPAFREALFEEHQSYLQLGGTKSGTDIDFDLPARIGTYLVMNNRPYKEILTASYCVDHNYNTAETCGDTFSDSATASKFGAGVMTTRGLIHLNKSRARFNFTVINHVSRKFICSSYPDAKDPGMSIQEISNLVHPWSNDSGCYACHKTLNARASLFYNFDIQGRYVADPNSGTTLRDTLQISKVSDLLTTTPPRYLGRNIATVRDYGIALSDDTRFAECMTKRYVNFMTGFDYQILPEHLKFLAKKFVDSNYSVKELLVNIALSNVFIRD